MATFRVTSTGLLSVAGLKILEFVRDADSADENRFPDAWSELRAEREWAYIAYTRAGQAPTISAVRGEESRYNYTPTGWSRDDPEPLATENVSRISRVAYYLGAPSSQTFLQATPWRYSPSDQRTPWWPKGQPRPAPDPPSPPPSPSPFPAAAERYLARIALNGGAADPAGQVEITVSDASDADAGTGHELSDEVAAGVRLTLSSGGESVQIDGFGSDRDDPYLFKPSNAAAVAAFADALSGSSTVTAEFLFPPPVTGLASDAALGALASDASAARRVAAPLESDASLGSATSAASTGAPSIRAKYGSHLGGVTSDARMSVPLSLVAESALGALASDAEAVAAPPRSARALGALASDASAAGRVAPPPASDAALGALASDASAAGRVAPPLASDAALGALASDAEVISPVDVLAVDRLPESAPDGLAPGWTVHVTLDDGSVEAADVRRFDRAANQAELPVRLARPTVPGAVCVFTAPGRAASLWRVLEVGEIDGLGRDIRARSHLPGRYAAVETGVNLDTFNPGGLDGQVTRPAGVSLREQTYDDGVATRSALQFGVQDPAGGRDPRVRGIDFELARVDSASEDTRYRAVVFQDAGAFELRDVRPGTYQARARYVTEDGAIRSAWRESAQLAAGGFGALAAPSGVTVAAVAGGYTVSWTRPAERDYAYSEILDRAAGGSAEVRGSASDVPWTRLGLAAEELLVSVRHVDRAGRRTPGSAEIAVTPESAEIDLTDAEIATAVDEALKDNKSFQALPGEVQRAETAADEAEAAALAAGVSATAADGSATAAAGSATTSSESATAADGSATAAASQATAAAASATASGTSATGAASSALSASGRASAAGQSASAAAADRARAQTAAGNAQASQTSAAASETAADGSATAAAQSALEAAAQATTAANEAAAAAASATASAASETAADGSATAAAQSALEAAASVDGVDESIEEAVAGIDVSALARAGVDDALASAVVARAKAGAAEAQLELVAYDDLDGGSASAIVLSADQIRLGDEFSIDSDGNLVASNITADHISADVRNFRPLWTGSIHVGGLSATWPIAETYRNFSSLELLVIVNQGGVRSYGNVIVPAGAINGGPNRVSVPVSGDDELTFLLTSDAAGTQISLGRAEATVPFFLVAMNGYRNPQDKASTGGSGSSVTTSTRQKTYYQRASAAPDAPALTTFAAYTTPGGGWSASDPGATTSQAVYQVTLTQHFNHPSTQTSSTFARNAWSAVTVHEARVPVANQGVVEYIYRRSSAASVTAPTGGTATHNDTPTNWSRSSLAATATLNVFRCSRTATYRGAGRTSSDFVSATKWAFSPSAQPWRAKTGVTPPALPDAVAPTSISIGGVSSVDAGGNAVSLPITPTGGTYDSIAYTPRITAGASYGSVTVSGAAVEFTPASSVTQDRSVTIEVDATASGSGTLAATGTSDTTSASEDGHKTLVVAQVDTTLPRPAAPSAVSIADGASTIDEGASTTFTASVTGGSGLEYDWGASGDLSPSAGSGASFTVTGDAVSAGGGSGTVTLRVRSTGDDTATSGSSAWVSATSASVTVDDVPALPAVTAPTVTVSAVDDDWNRLTDGVHVGATETFQATVAGGSYDSIAYSWGTSFSGEIAGNATGTTATYQAPSSIDPNKERQIARIWCRVTVDGDGITHAVGAVRASDSLDFWVFP